MTSKGRLSLRGTQYPIPMEGADTARVELQGGFSLTELLIASVVMVAMVGVLAAVLRVGQRSFQVTQNTMTISYELRRGINLMSRDLAQTQGAQLNIPADGNWYNNLSFRIPQDLDANGTVLNGAGVLEWSNPIQYLLGGVDNQQAQRIQNGNTQVLAHRVTLLRFRRTVANPSIVEVNFQVQRGANLGGFIQQANVTTRVRLRN